MTMANRRTRKALLGILMLGAAIAHPEHVRATEPMSLGFVEAGRAVLGFDAVASNFAIADFDGDGFDDVAFCARSGGTVLFVAGQASGVDVRFKQSMSIPDDGALARLVTVKIDGNRHLFTIALSGVVRDYTGWPLQQVGSYAIDPLVAAAAGDVYANGAPVLVALTTDHVNAYVLETAEPLWSYPFTGGTGIAVAQLDADPAAEVIINAPAGRVIDGATQAIDWQYDGPFGADLASGHLIGDGTTQFFGAVYTSFNVFRGAPWTALWSAGAITGGIAALAAVDLDHNGRDVILQGDAQWGAVNAYDPATHLLRFSIPNPGWGIAALDAADLDGDGTAEVVFANYSSVGNTAVEAVDSNSGQIKWAFTPQGGLFAPVAIGDVDGDGQLEIVVADAMEPVYSVAGEVRIYDAVSGALKWQSPGGSMGTRRILLRRHSNDLAMDIVLAGETFYDGKIVSIDGASQALKFQVYARASGPLGWRDLVDAQLVDFDHDGSDDVVVATGAGDTLLQVFSGSDGHLMWTSPAMAAGSPGINSVLVRGSPADASELVAVLDGGLVGYKVQDPTSSWTLDAASDGATYLQNADEFALFRHDGSIDFYAAADRSYLHAMILPAPLNAVGSLDGSEPGLLAASAGTLTFANGSSGEIVARSPQLGANLGRGNQLAAIGTNDGASLVVGGDEVGVYRYLLEMTSDRLMQSGFEVP